MTLWLALDKRFRPEQLGFLPEILTDSDPRSVKEQLEDRYAHGGGWRPITGMHMNPETRVMYFPGDPPFKPAALTEIGEEVVIFYPLCSLLAVIQPDGSYQVTRVD
jgi:hypothetical protein